MYQINFNQPLHIHFIGIGGISMSGLAEILLKNHFTVSGSDAKESEMTTHLRSLGATIAIGQSASNITDDIDLVVYTAAIHPDNEELQEVGKKNIPSITRAELLGQIMANYKTPIAISGTHGKTTTTSMLSTICLEASEDPTITVGGILDAIKGNIRVGHSDIFITEACEYTNSFLSFFPKISVILNVEEDHLDFFSGIEEIRDSFHRFAKLLPEDGLLVLNEDIDNYQELATDIKCKTITYGFSDNANYQAKNITYDELGCGHYDLYKDGAFLTKIDLNVTGIHNVSNSLATVAVADYLGLSLTDITKGLSLFTGTKRRFEKKGVVGGVTVIDDYAHHPTEIAATLKAAKKNPHRELWCVFQPHTYTRTKAFLHEFADALKDADHVIITDIYAAREVDTGEIHAKDLVKEIQKHNPNATYISSFDEIIQFLLSHCVPQDMLITMGAGDVVKIGEEMLGQ